MNKEKIALILCLFIATITIAQNNVLVDELIAEKNQIENCYAKLDNNTLVIGNGFVERSFKWNKGDIISINILNKKAGNSIEIKNGETPDFIIKDREVKDNKLLIEKVDATPIVPAYLSAEITSIYEGLEVKRRFKLFPSSMGIACEYYLKKTSDDLVLKVDDISIENLKFHSSHWGLEAIEFIDNTDHNDNLLRKSKIVPYKTNKHIGNILFMQHTFSNQGLYLLKEAPCSAIQNNYPGYDFVSTVHSGKPKSLAIQSVGLGVTDADLKLNEWVKTYSYVIGVHDNTDYGKKIALRSYQNNTRTLLPERDNIIMVNTWGDRNADGRINEKFILEELHKAHKLGFTHYMIDDGWQQGLSMNSKFAGEKKWDEWSLKDWQPHKKRFPNGFSKILKLADSLNIEMGLWFHPSNENEYAKWEQDANIVINLFNQYGIKYIKIDGIKLPTKKADINLRRFFDKILKETNYRVVFDLDATADNRYGYHYNNDVGNIYLENRYTDWQNYYPYRTLRNIWMLSAYLPPQKFQLEFLNKWRNEDKYGDDPYAPYKYSFDYVFAVTMPSQPLAFLETTGLPEEAKNSVELFKTYRAHNSTFLNAQIFPIGNEPNGATYTGFQYITSSTGGYLLVFRELNDVDEFYLSTLFTPSTTIEFEKVYGDGADFKATAGYDGMIQFNIDKPNSFCLYKYAIKNSGKK